MNVYIKYPAKRDPNKELLENLYYEKWYYKLMYHLAELAEDMEKESEGFILMTGPYDSEPFKIWGFSKELSKRIKSKIGSFTRFVG